MRSLARFAWVAPLAFGTSAQWEIPSCHAASPGARTKEFFVQSLPLRFRLLVQVGNCVGLHAEPLSAAPTSWYRPKRCAGSRACSGS